MVIAIPASRARPAERAGTDRAPGSPASKRHRAYRRPRCTTSRSSGREWTSSAGSRQPAPARWQAYPRNIRRSSASCPRWCRRARAGSAEFTSEIRASCKAAGQPSVAECSFATPAAPSRQRKSFAQKVARLLKREPQERDVDLHELVVEAQARQREARLAPRQEHQMQVRWRVAQDERHQLVTALIGDDVKILEE